MPYGGRDNDDEFCTCSGNVEDIFCAVSWIETSSCDVFDDVPRPFRIYFPILEGLSTEEDVRRPAEAEVTTELDVG